MTHTDQVALHQIGLEVLRTHAGKAAVHDFGERCAWPECQEPLNDAEGHFCPEHDANGRYES